MIWLAWRQQRLEAALGAAVLAALAALLLLTGRHVAAVYASSHLAACTLGRAQPATCGGSVTSFTARFASLVSLTNWFNLVPLLLGILAAAPIVLDLEQGTHRLAWTQTISRRRWLATRLALALAVAVAAGAAFSLLMTWWRGPFDHLGGRFDTDAFDFEGTVPVAYTVFAAAAVLAVGAALRRTLPAVTIGIVAFLVVRLGVEGSIRYQHYLAPLHRTWPVGGAAPAGEASGYIESSGVTVHAAPGIARRTVDACNVRQTDPRSLESVSGCLRHHHVLQSAIYQPAGRFWTFQAIESALFLVLAAILLGVAAWRIQYRTA